MSETSPYITSRDIRTIHPPFLFIATVLVLYLSGRILQPFVSPLTWSIAFAILLTPLADRINARIRERAITATILTLCVGLGITLPGLWSAHVLFDAAISGVSAILPMSISQLKRHYPEASAAIESIESTFQISASLGALLQTLGQQTQTILAMSLWGAVSLLLTLFTLFYLIRDGERFLSRIGPFLPLSSDERELLYNRISDTIHATLFGSVVVSAMQGFLGGVLMWWLNLPGAALWGLIMGLLALVPYLGAFVVWMPLAALFVIQGHWHDAALTTLWGMIVIGLSDNILYPILVGKRLRYHSLLVFFFLVGGVWYFGAAGIILGPVILAIVDTTIDLWRGNARSA